MRRLLNYLKPYLVPIIVSAGLLFLQANANLALPDYLSRIVNVGIQQNGVEDAVPAAIRESEMERLFLFMNEEEQALVQESYDLIEPGTSGAEANITRYPLLATESVYVLGEAADDDALNAIMGKALVVVSGIEMILEDPSQAPAMMEGAFDLSQIPPGMDVFDMLPQLPPQMRAQLSDTINEQFEALGESMVTQMAVSAVRAEYDALGADTVSLQRDYILRTGAVMLLISLLGGAATVGVGLLSSRTSAGVARDIRKDLFSKVESFSSAEFNAFSTASLITRSTNDVTQVQMVVFMMMRLMLFAPIMGIGGVIRAIEKSANMWWLIALAVIVLLGLILVIFAITMPRFQMMQKLVDRLNLVTRENLSGMMVIRAFNKQDEEEARFEKANVDLTDTTLFVTRVMVMMMPIMMLIMNGLTVAIVWVGAQQVAQATIQVGDMIAFIQYAMEIVMSFLMMSMMFVFLPRAAVSGGRIADVLETELIITDPEQPKALPGKVEGRIEFRNVYFRYPDAEECVLHDISFTAQPGETTAFIGSTGCGKSTVVNLIPRFFDVTRGSVLLDGIDVRELRQHDLRESIGYVPQHGMLFSGTVASNLRYADENAREDDLKEAADIAQASEFIFEREGGMESAIAQGGTNVSGGQKQRLSIARALVGKPPVFIFDDSFSALDFKTAADLRRALKAKTGDSTVLVVTQRVATVKNADQIVVLDEGRVVGKGRHHDLMQTCETYQEIARSQLSEEELA